MHTFRLSWWAPVATAAGPATGPALPSLLNGHEPKPSISSMATEAISRIEVLPSVAAAITPYDPMHPVARAIVPHDVVVHNSTKTL